MNKDVQSRTRIIENSIFGLNFPPSQNIRVDFLKHTLLLQVYTLFYVNEIRKICKFLIFSAPGNGCKSFTPVVSISGYNFMNVKSEGIDALAESIYNNGPHTVYVYANSNFQRYHSGIFDDTSCSTSSYNHAVINIGYDVNEGYWTIRNSWATSWGEQGHIRMARGKNTCNIEHYAWVPYL